MDDEKFNKIFLSLGRIEGKQDQMREHIVAVSAKAGDIRRELDKHKEDDEAHGLGGERRGTGSVLGYISLAIAIGGLLFSVFRR
jgi:hypothetical protein